MNFFKLYIGDYQRDTAHLSIAEHGAYMLMLQHYYATQNPLPKGKALHRMLRAQDKAERDAIDSVSNQFWTETDAGLINERAMVEIQKASTQADTNARIAREREAKRKASQNDNETSTNRATNTQPNHSHSQTTILSNIEGYKLPSSNFPNSHPPLEGQICAMLKQEFAMFDVNPSHEGLKRLVDRGLTVQYMRDLAAEFKLSKPDKLKFAYLISTAKGRMEDEKAGNKPTNAKQANRDKYYAERDAEHARLRAEFGGGDGIFDDGSTIPEAVA